MNRIIKAAVAALIFAVSFAGSVAAGPLEDAAIAAAAAELDADYKAIAAYQKGDYTTALRLWRPLAERGNSDAQSVLGDIYDQGQGVPQDHTAAVSWWRKAARQGDRLARRNLERTYLKGLSASDEGDYATALR
jgi:TPR repeat protein